MTRVTKAGSYDHKAQTFAPRPEHFVFVPFCRKLWETSLTAAVRRHIRGQHEGALLSPKGASRSLLLVTSFYQNSFRSCIRPLVIVDWCNCEPAHLLRSDNASIPLVLLTAPDERFYMVQPFRERVSPQKSATTFLLTLRPRATTFFCAKSRSECSVPITGA